MGEQAREVARQLGVVYRDIDVSQDPEVARRHRQFFPGMIIMDQFSLTYPGSPEQIIESFKRQGPLPGQMNWRPLQPKSVEQIVPLTLTNAHDAAQVCMGSGRGPESCAKQAWLAHYASIVPGGVLGYLGHDAGRPVSGVEFLPEELIPYPIPIQRPDWAFITCIYGHEHDHDYRGDLIAHLKAELPKLGYQGISVVAGMETPYPNGPLSFFTAHGFQPGSSLGRALLRHKWEELAFCQYDF